MTGRTGFRDLSLFQWVVVTLHCSLLVVSQLVRLIVVVFDEWGLETRLCN